MWQAEYVPEGDIYFIQISDGEVHKTLERKPDILVDVDQDRNVLSIEVVGATETPVADLMRVLNEFGLVAAPPAASAA